MKYGGYLKLNGGRVRQRTDFSGVLALLTTSVVVSALYLGHDVLIPFALALLLSFLLTPPVTWLEKLRLGRIPSVLVVFVAAFSAFGAVSWLALTQLGDTIVMLKRPAW